MEASKCPGSSNHNVKRSDARLATAMEPTDARLVTAAAEPTDAQLTIAMESTDARLTTTMVKPTVRTSLT